MYINIDWKYLTRIELFPEPEKDSKEKSIGLQTAAIHDLTKSHSYPAAQTSHKASCSSERDG
jgi:hypothetical protein